MAGNVKRIIDNEYIREGELWKYLTSRGKMGKEKLNENGILIDISFTLELINKPKSKQEYLSESTTLYKYRNGNRLLVTYETEETPWYYQMHDPIGGYYKVLYLWIAKEKIEFYPMDHHKKYIYIRREYNKTIQK